MVTTKVRSAAPARLACVALILLPSTLREQPGPRNTFLFPLFPRNRSPNGILTESQTRLFAVPVENVANIPESLQDEVTMVRTTVYKHGARMRKLQDSYVARPRLNAGARSTRLLADQDHDAQ
jgi:hypothetical protein